MAVTLQSGACTHVNRATLAASTVALAWDGVYTYRAAAANWHGGPPCSGGVQIESNPIMGRNPSTGTVVSYFATAISLNAVLWLAMPERYKSLVPLGIIGVQTRTIAGNIDQSHNCTKM